MSRYDPKRYEREQSESDSKVRGYDDERYDNLDSRYYKADPALAKIVENYIRAHLDEDFRAAQPVGGGNGHPR
jgi:hypothetical protein